MPVSVNGKHKILLSDVEIDVALWPTLTPPTGEYRVTKVYINATGKLVVEYDDTPEP